MKVSCSQRKVELRHVHAYVTEKSWYVIKFNPLMLCLRLYSSRSTMAMVENMFDMLGI